MNTTKQINPTPVRLPPELKVWLQHEAVDREGGNLNREIVRRLQQSRERQLAAQQPSN
ncbi:MAG: hypothetical protein JSR41_07660 [Proteobacteria bacterium]|nr:hypothetical protein [Pseudomonadota bacterium]